MITAFLIGLLAFPFRFGAHNCPDFRASVNAFLSSDFAISAEDHGGHHNFQSFSAFCFAESRNGLNFLRRDANCELCKLRFCKSPKAPDTPKSLEILGKHCCSTRCQRMVLNPHVLTMPPLL